MQQSQDAPTPPHETSILGAAGAIESIAAPGRTRYPALDGLRGLAILMVMACHYAMQIPGTGVAAIAARAIALKGWAGVDLFFVLSGFLITGILYDAKGQAHYFRNFYARRTLRIFPLYFGFLTAILAAVILYRFAFHADYKHSRLGHQLTSYQPWLWTYTANFWMAFHDRFMAIVGHFWTLCIEEQFYLIWPLVVVLCSRRALIRICLAVVLGSLLLRLALTAAGCDWLFIFTFTPAHVDPLALGALVALASRGSRGAHHARTYAKWLGVATGTLLCGALAAAAFLGLSWHGGQLSSAPRLAHPAWWGSPWATDFLLSLLGIFFASLLVHAARADGIVYAIFRWRPLRFIGGYSYGIYVYHLPIFMGIYLILSKTHFFERVEHSGPLRWLLIAVNFVLSIGVAFASFHLYEKHFLKLKKYFPERTAVRPTDGRPAPT